MKQFQYTDTHRGIVFPARNFEEAAAGLPEFDRGSLLCLTVGQQLRMLSGYWTRLPDLGEAPRTPDEPKCDERLERIATATLQGLITGVVSVPELAAAHAAGAKEKGFTFEQYLARDAVAMAKALISELDKQA